MYNLIPEKYLPTRYSENVAYYPDGTYQHVYKSDVITIFDPDSFPANYNQLLVPTDRTSTSEPFLSGHRTVRNIVIKGISEIVTTAMNTQTFYQSASYFFGLLVIRQGQSAPNDRDNLAVHQHVCTIAPPSGSSLPSAVDEDEWTLVYPGTIELHSGDYVQLSLQVNSQDTPTPLLHGSITYEFVYDIQFN